MKLIYVMAGLAILLPGAGKAAEVCGVINDAGQIFALGGEMTCLKGTSATDTRNSELIAVSTYGNDFGVFGVCVQYSSKSGTNLTNCSIKSYTCERYKYLSGNKCFMCNDGNGASWGLYPEQEDSDMPEYGHSRTTCGYCKQGMYDENFGEGGDASCVECPDGGTTDIPEQITDCYLPAGTSFSDTTGKGTYSGKCFWRTF